MVEITPQIPSNQYNILPSKISHSHPLLRDILPIPLNAIWETKLGTSKVSLYMFSSILNSKYSNQGIKLQAKGSFQWVNTMESNRKDPGSYPRGSLAVLRSILTSCSYPTSSQSSWQPASQDCQNAVINIGNSGCPLDNSPKSVVGQPNNRQRNYSF